MDARIGELNGGKFYAFVNGYDAPAFTGTLAQVEAALNGRGGEVTPAQAKKIAERAGVSCQFHSLGKVWTISNKRTGQEFPYSSGTLKAKGKNWFVAHVERIASGESLPLFNVKDDAGHDYGNVRAVDKRAACDQVAMQYGHESEHAWNEYMHYSSHVVGLGGPDHCKLTATEI